MWQIVLKREALLRVLKDLRSELVHEYLEEDYVEKFEEVLFWIEKLFEIAGNIKRYCRQFEEIER